jgi:hypothetical protein
MGLYAIDCPGCGKAFMWFSGNLPNQFCDECNKPKICPLVMHNTMETQIDEYKERMQNVYRKELTLDEVLHRMANDPQLSETLREYCANLIANVKY